MAGLDSLVLRLYSFKRKNIQILLIFLKVVHSCYRTYIIQQLITQSTQKMYHKTHHVYLKLIQLFKSPSKSICKKFPLNYPFCQAFPLLENSCSISGTLMVAEIFPCQSLLPLTTWELLNQRILRTFKSFKFNKSRGSLNKTGDFLVVGTVLTY